MFCHVWKLLSISGNLPTALQRCFNFVHGTLIRNCSKRNDWHAWKLQASHLGALVSIPNFRMFPGEGLMALVHYQSRSCEKKTRQEEICPDVYFPSWRVIKHVDQMFKAIRNRKRRKKKSQNQCSNAFCACPELMLRYQCCSWFNFLLMALNIWSISFATSNTAKSTSWIPWRGTRKEICKPNRDGKEREEVWANLLGR